MSQFADPANPYPPQPKSKGASILWWILGGGFVIVLICCVGGLGSVMYIGTVGPETSVYTGSNVPSRFINTMRDEGALEDGEQILFFYSDAITDIRDGFYFVSDRRVVVYIQGTGDPLTSIPFDSIESAEIFRDESFFDDSQIILFLEDGPPVSFPVSSEYNRDQQFFDAIMERIEGGEQ